MEAKSEIDEAHAEMAARVLPLIDLTSLGDDDTEAMISKLCADAVTPHGSVAAVCVWPRFVAKAASLLSDAPVGVAAVANFPEGSVDIDRATSDAAEIVSAGGTEVDVVYPWRALMDGDLTVGPELVAATRVAIGPDIGLKVILETGELGEDRLIRQAAVHAVHGGADFLKTSTGKTTHSATPEAARVLLDVISEAERPVGIKISGGIRTVNQAAVYIELADAVMGPGWVGPETFRFGASGLLADVLGATDQTPAGDY